jgi:predicted cation transporter
MIRIHHVLAAVVAVTGLAFVADSVVAKGKHQHHNGHQLLGDKIKKDGTHTLHKNGDYEATVQVTKGKVAGVKVKHAKKGDVPVKKYKTTKKMVQAGAIQAVAFSLAQVQDLGTTWIGYAYIDDYGDEVIYWFPYDVIYDGATGAIEYIPVY